MAGNAKRRPGRGGAATTRISTDDAIELSRPLDAPQALALHCAGCGVAGTAPRIVPSIDSFFERDEVLVPVLGWHDDGRPALLCPQCRHRLAKNRGRARYSKPKPTDGHLL